jgi:hypothetical protein
MGKLVQVATSTVSSPVSSVTLTGIDSDDVYMVAISNIAPETDVRYLQMRVTKDVSGTPTPQTTANYDRAVKQLRTGGTFVNGSGTNLTLMYACAEFLGTGTQEVANGIFYIYNASNPSEYTFFTKETTFRDYNSGELKGDMGGMVYTVAEVHNGIQFFMSSGNIASGTFTLYKVL